ncbi:MAG: cation-translocating P-type ATPase [Lysinibacillus sp.]
MSLHYNQTTDEVLRTIGAAKEGLSDAEAAERRSSCGYNELQEGERKSTWQVFFSQFRDFLVIILLISAAISIFLGEWGSATVIIGVVILNAILGTVQHVKAEHSLNSLKQLAAPTAKVLRNGLIVQIPSRELVVGDIYQLEAGDYISADGRILESHGLQINESSLTGESVPVEKSNDKIDDKNVPIGDQKNMVFSGSFVTNGRAAVVITAIGMQTEIGKIAGLLGQAKEKKTPLQRSLDQFGKKLAIGIIAICSIIFVLDIIRGREIAESFMFVVSLAVAAIPEALSSIVTIVLAFGTQKMAKENAIIRNLHAVESLGSVSVICSDKTGTLTQNKMMVQKLYVADKTVEYDELDVLESELEREFLMMALLCNDSETVEGKEVGDPTELALVNLGEHYGIDELEARQKHPRIGEVPFDSDRKCMSTVNRFGDADIMITKGAVDVLLKRIKKIAAPDGTRQVTAQEIERIEQVNELFSKEGLRVLAFTYKPVTTHQITTADEDDLIFVGMTAMMDPPREESKPAVEACIQAGIRPVMITGDHKITASAIARQIGILKDDGEAVEGREIEALTDEELRANVERFSVYARVSPEHKIRIVKAWQDRGNVVAMTGDGVNDGPALKQADIGVAMGITGTEVAKDASSMVLTDDNFSTIVKAISNGRSIYANIQNAIRFLLSGNTGAILVVLYATLFALPAPFAPVHLLFINLLTDSLPAIAIGLEPHNEKVMQEGPRDTRVSLLNRSFAATVLAEGAVIALAAGAAYEIGRHTDALTGVTMAFATLCLARLFHGFNCRSKDPLYKVGIFSNKQSWVAFLVGVALLHLVLFVPGLSGIFEVAALDGRQLGTVYLLSILPLIVIQLWKTIKK